MSERKKDIQQLKKDTIKNILNSPGLSMLKRKILKALAKKNELSN